MVEVVLRRLDMEIRSHIFQHSQNLIKNSLTFPYLINQTKEKIGGGVGKKRDSRIKGGFSHFLRGIKIGLKSQLYGCTEIGLL